MNLLKDEYSEEPGACHGHSRPGVGTDKILPWTTIRFESFSQSSGK